MIIDRSNFALLYAGLSQNIRDALSLMRSANYSQFETGKHELDGERIYLLMQKYTTKPRQGGIWEAHRKYIDIQYMIEGVESLGYNNFGQLQMVKYDETRDFYEMKGDGEFITLRPGNFVILYPQDAHMPGIAVDQPSQVVKAVFKVRV
jgi:YhcH/YjgK/YiaL family protein